MALKTGDKFFDSFRGGRYTRNNLVRVSDDHLLVANQLIWTGDGILRKRPGYTLVGNANVGFSPTRIFDFRRQSDQKQFVIIAGAGKIGYISANGGAFNSLVTGEDPTAVWSFVTNTFGLYASNGIHAYRFIDTGNGLLAKFNWGIQAPIAAPSISTIGGALTLNNGRQYAYSYVSKWTDSLGTQRVHVGPPSPLSASTNAVTNVVVQLSNLLASADPQVTHIWIWSTNDTPFDTTSVLFFNAEITNGTTTYGDSLQDTSLDTSRQAPYNNFAPPAGQVLIEFQSRFAISGISGKPDLVQGTGLEEIDLGIPQETAPPSVFFNVPGGIKKVVGGKEFNESLMIGTELFWFLIRGFSAETFEEHDNIFEPGPAGLKLIATTPQWIVWLSKDKKLWAWDGVNQPIEISWKIARADGSNQLSMENINDAQLANGELHWFSFGRYNILALFVSTQNNTYFDWCQLWDASVLTAPAGPYGAVTKDGMLQGAAESDAFFTDHIVAAANVLVGSTKYLFLADTAGNIYRWPDGFTDNGKPYAPVAGSEFSDLDAPGLVKRNRWMDVLTSRIDAVTAFQASAVASDGMNVQLSPLALAIQPLPAQYGVDPTTFRAKLEAKGVSIGRFLRWFIEWPIDDQDAEIYEVQVKYSIVGKDPR